MSEGHPKYPYLHELLGGYFHQDAYDEGHTNADIMRDFKATSWAHQQLGVRADIRRLLHEHADDLLAFIETEFAPSVIVGRTNDEARSWLSALDAALD